MSLSTVSLLVDSDVKAKIWCSPVVFDVNDDSQGSHARDRSPGVIMEMGGSMAL